MPERTAAEVLAAKLKAAFVEATCLTLTAQNIELVAARLAEDPAITVRTDMAVERFVVEFHIAPAPWPAPPPNAGLVMYNLTSEHHFVDEPGYRIIVRPYPEEPK